ncbi:MAG: GNAT family N-acetyltransferase [Alphaproteobacteria bacterium]|nr:GNAT family N-acetyltransferase [Alphaproteobacteria bacterium]
MDTDIIIGDETELHVRLARDISEIEAAQHLRYKVFYEEYNAQPSPETLKTQLDVDEYDSVSDHLIVIDPSLDDDKRIVGTYRLIQQGRADKFYSSQEFNVEKLEETGAHLLEMGRSCVLEPYRTRHVLQLLWQGIAHYVFDNNIGLMFGCASLHGTDPETLTDELSYLYHYHLAPPALRPEALPEVFTNMNLKPSKEINVKQTFQKLPPLVKGYLRAGSMIGKGAYIDHQFNTIDVCIVLPTAFVSERYIKHYERLTGKTVSPDILNLFTKYSTRTA